MTEAGNPGLFATSRTKLTGQQVNWQGIDCPTIYGNVMAMSLTPVDLSIMIGEIDKATPDEVFAKPRLKLILTPEFASIFLQVMARGLELYVQTNGPLRANAFPRAEAEAAKSDES